MSLYPAILHAQKVVHKLVSQDEIIDGCHAILLVSHETPMRNDTDREMPHRPESNFYYLTGCDIPGSAVLISFSYLSGNVQDVKHQLFVPQADEDSKMWSVPPPSIEEASALFETHFIQPILSLQSTVSSLGSTHQIHTLPPTLLFPALPTFMNAYHSSKQASSASLLPAIHQARLTKTPFEIENMERANKITSAAHEVVMRELGRFAGGRASMRGIDGRPLDLGGQDWEIEGEGDAEALFTAVCRRGGSKHLSYMPIVAGGPRAATLHYICNHQPFTHHLPTTLTSSSFSRSATSSSSSHHHSHDGATNGDAQAHAHDEPDPLDVNALRQDWAPQVLLIDAGTEWNCYGADVTRTMPVGNGGKFTERSGEIYQLVLDMQKAAEEIIKAGIHWDTVHLLMHKILISNFLRLGIFQNGTEEEILASGVSTGFFPHGLGHSIGLDVHDVPSASKPATNPTIPAQSLENPQLYKFLRLRLPLEQGMIITIEPGCYFSPHVLAPWRSSPFLNTSVLAEYEPMGGVRIEDVVLVEEKGIRNLTTAVRERKDVERLCSGEK
ncbi:Putative metallopeptidase [Phaffia rhodozyma]|uniref:Putative metallopeptidase n=1 Tax=Phaffia rhodozyma TaxID=264483 RepID=A0A0F7SXI7_PHARH|nr:Putative metallopeptidase [Phaffia rhodozyma]